MKHLFQISLVFLFYCCTSSTQNDDRTLNTLEPNKYDTTGLEITSEPISETQYWESVDRARVNADDDREFLDDLTKELETWTPKELVGFRLRTDILLSESYSSELWCAAYIMNGGCSDDGFEYFRCWLISNGQVMYEAAINDPDSIALHLEAEQEYYELEEFWYAANNVFDNKTGKDLNDYIDRDVFNYGESHYVGTEFTWSEDDPESMKVICPRLYSRFIEKL